MGLSVIASLLEGNTVDVTWTFSDPSVTAVTSISGDATDLNDSTQVLTFSLAQVASSNVWTGFFTPTQPSKRWNVRVFGMIATKSFEGAGLVRVNSDNID